MAEINALSLLTLFGVTIILGYAGSLIFDKTRIPDVIWLFIFGILIGPVFALVDVSLFLAISPFLAAIAILIILFDAGLNMNLYQMLRGFPRALLLAVVGIIVSALAVAFFSVYALNLSFMEGLFLGVVLSGTSSPIVISIVSRLKIGNSVKTTLNLESVITDPLVIIVAIAILNMMAATMVTYSPQQIILSAFSIGAVIGLIGGVLWLIILDKLKGRPFDYMLTLAALFIVYVVVESVSGSGAIAALAFGLVLGNGHAFSTMLKFRKKFRVDSLLLTFQSEVSFFIRSFFFVFLGIIMVIDATFIVFGLLISIILIVTRFVAVEISVIKMKLTYVEKNIMRIMGPKGLAAAVLAQLPFTFGLARPELYSNIILVVILVTVIYSTVMTHFFYSEKGKGKKGDVKDTKKEEQLKMAKKQAKEMTKDIRKESAGAKKTKA